MIHYIIPLIGSYFDSGIAAYYLFLLIAIAFVATVPAIFRYFWRG